MRDLADFVRLFFVMNIPNVINLNVNRFSVGSIVKQDPYFFLKAGQYKTARIANNHTLAGEYAFVSLLRWSPGELAFDVRTIEGAQFCIGLECLADFVL